MSSGIVQSDNKNPERVAAGLKASIHNPNVSAEAKTRARDRLAQMGVDLDSPASTQRAKDTVDTFDEADYGRVLDNEDEELLRNKRPLQSDTRHAGSSKHGKFAGMDLPEDDDADFGDVGRSRGSKGGQAGEGREMGGYKATVKNPNIGNEAKEYAKQVLRDNDAI